MAPWHCACYERWWGHFRDLTHSYWGGPKCLNFYPKRCRGESKIRNHTSDMQLSFFFPGLKNSGRVATTLQCQRINFFLFPLVVTNHLLDRQNTQQSSIILFFFKKVCPFIQSDYLHFLLLLSPRHSLLSQTNLVAEKLAVEHVSNFKSFSLPTMSFTSFPLKRQLMVCICFWLQCLSANWKKRTCKLCSE